MKKTQEEVSTFFQTARNYISENCDKEGNPKVEDKKDLFYALRRMMVRLQKSQRKYNDKVQDLEEKYAAVDEKEMLVRDERNQYRYKRQDKLKLNAELINLFETSTTDFDPYITATVPTDLDDELREAFSGFVISPEVERKDEQPV